MSTTLTERLNQILPRITNKTLLSSEGIGNEIACYIFDYSAQDELLVREHIQMLMGYLESHFKELHVLHLDLLDVIVAYLNARGLLEKTLKMDRSKDTTAVLRALKGPLTAEKIRDFIDSEHRPAEYDLMLLSGIGSAWPMLRAHSLLNCLHTIMEQTPLVMFYPGTFDGTTLRLFGQIASTTAGPTKKSYYRAFRLIPKETSV